MDPTAPTAVATRIQNPKNCNASGSRNTMKALPQEIDAISHIERRQTQARVTFTAPVYVEPISSRGGHAAGPITVTSWRQAPRTASHARPGVCYLRAPQ